MHPQNGLGLRICGLNPKSGLLWGFKCPAAGIAVHAAASNTHMQSLLCCVVMQSVSSLFKGAA